MDRSTREGSHTADQGLLVVLCGGGISWEKWDPISARNEGGATSCKGTLLRRATPPLKVSFLE